MRIIFAASLLLSGSVSLVKSAAEIPASFNDALQSYSAKRDEFLQYSKEQVIHQVLAQIRSLDASNRYLQATSAPTSVCNADQTVNFDDDFSLIAFGSDFNPTCSCSEENNQKEVTAALQALVLNLTDSFADDFNTLFATLYSDVAYTCTNGCESCYDGVCGLFETTTESSVSYNKPNFTMDQILNQQIDPTPFTANFTFLVMNCVQYTSGLTLNGRLCFGIDIDSPADVTSAGQVCILEYDNVACNSCVIDLSSSDGCYVADCTNIDTLASIDSCARTGYVGPFAFLGALRSDGFNATDLTLGSCDVMSAPVAVRAVTPTGSPIVIADTGGSSLGLFFGGIAVGMALMAVIGFLALRQRMRRRPPSSSSGAVPPVPTAATPSETSVVAIPASVDQFPRIRHADSVQDAMPMPTAPIMPVRSPLHAHPPVSYKDQAREHPNVVPISGAWAAEATQPRPRASNKAEPPGQRGEESL